ncbi:hypothetical protein GCM10027072_64290 [Streptomyces bullii]
MNHGIESPSFRGLLLQATARNAGQTDTTAVLLEGETRLALIGRAALRQPDGHGDHERLKTIKNQVAAETSIHGMR